MIFGNKIKIIFIIGAKFILDNNWNNFDDIENFKKNFIESNKFIKDNIWNIKEIRKEDLLKELLIGVESDELKLTVKNSVFACRTLMVGFEEQIEDDNVFDYFFFWERINVSDFVSKEMPRKNSNKI